MMLRVELLSAIAGLLLCCPGCGNGDASGAVMSPVSQQPGSEQDPEKKKEPAKGEEQAEDKTEEKPAEAKPAPEHPGLRNPDAAQEKAPDKFKVRFETTKGPFVVEVVRDWAPLGVDRFFNLVKVGYFTDIAFFRVIPGFMSQFGIHGDPEINGIWSGDRIKDDPVVQSNMRGYVTFATAGPNTRSNQFFINTNTQGNARLDGMGFAPFGFVSEGMANVDKIYSGYGGGPSEGGRGPNQPMVSAQGNEYLKRNFPELDYIKSAKIVE